MKAILTFLTLALFASPLLAKKYPGLKVKGNYKELRVVVENVPNNTLGLAEEDVERAVKLRLLANGIKGTKTISVHYLYVDVAVLTGPNAFKIDIFLQKFSDAYGVDEKVAGAYFLPEQGYYGTLGTAGRSKQYILEALNEKLDKFLLDYLESNIE